MNLCYKATAELSEQRRRALADDKRTIKQDVLRTRGDDDFFRDSDIRNLLKVSIEAFCLCHDINYMQGMNEILAPILTIDTSNVLSSFNNDTLQSDVEPYDPTLLKYRVNLLLFERFVKRLCPATFSSKGVNALQAQLTSFHLLLTYHDPVLSTYLRDRCSIDSLFPITMLCLIHCITTEE